MTTETKQPEQALQQNTYSTLLHANITVDYLLGEKSQQHLTETIQPFVADAQQRMVEAVRKKPIQGFKLDYVPGRQHAQRRLISNAWQSILTFVVSSGKKQSEQILRPMLHAALADTFSNTLRAHIREQSRQALRSVSREGIEILPSNSKNKNLQRKIDRRLDAALDDMLERLSSPEVREDADRQVDELIHAMVQGDLAAARRRSQHALQALIESVVLVQQEYWTRVSHLVLSEVAGALQGASKSEKSGKAEKQEPESKAEQHGPKPEEQELKGKAMEPTSDSPMPQTIARSDERVQSIWKKVHDRAATDQNGNGSADRAAYDELRQHYEKKGDRWVKKSNGARSDPKDEAKAPTRRGSTGASRNANAHTSSGSREEKKTPAKAQSRRRSSHT